MIILLNRCGQLANRLFMFASFIALAEKYKLKIVNLAFFEFQRHFKQTSQDLFCRYPANTFNFLKHREVNYLIYLIVFYFFKLFRWINPFKKRLLIIDLDKSDININLHCCDENVLWTAKNGVVIILHGWVDVTTNFDDQQAAVIKSYFTIKDEHKKNVDLVVQKTRQRGDVVIGVHIRHGDYRRFRRGKHFYSLETYVDFMNQIRSFFPDKNVVFLICSNESQDAAKLVGLNYLFGTGHRVEDLYALSHCDYVIGPPSTYTMWASFYGQVPLCVIEDATLVLSKYLFKPLSLS